MSEGADSAGISPVRRVEISRQRDARKCPKCGGVSWRVLTTSSGQIVRAWACAQALEGAAGCQFSHNLSGDAGAAPGGSSWDNQAGPGRTGQALSRRNGGKHCR